MSAATAIELFINNIKTKLGNQVFESLKFGEIKIIPHPKTPIVEIEQEGDEKGIYTRQIKEIADSVKGVSFIIKQSNTKTISSKENDLVTRRKEVDKEFRKNFNYVKTEQTFDSFVIGDSNSVAYLSAQKAAMFSENAVSPLIFYSESGLGKTHLLYAIYNYVKINHKDKKIVFVRAIGFLNAMIKALKNDCFDYFQEYFHSADIVLIDDIHFFVGKEKSKNEFFYTFDYLLNSGIQIIFTSDRYPNKISDFEDRIKTRLNLGATLEIKPPEYETRVLILLHYAKEINIDIDDEVAYFLASKIKANIRELQGALTTLKQFVGIINEKITIDLTKEILQDLLSQYEHKSIDIDKIQKTVAEFYKIKFSDLVSSKRSQNIVKPRQIAMYISKEHTHMSYNEIGKAFGGKDHSTVIHAITKIVKQLKEDKKLNQDYNYLLNTLVQ